MTFRVYSDKRGEWRWRLLAENGRIIADSAEGYNERHSAIQGVQLVRDNALAAVIIVEGPGGGVVS